MVFLPIFDMLVMLLQNFLDQTLERNFLCTFPSLARSPNFCLVLLIAY